MLAAALAAGPVATVHRTLVDLADDLTPHQLVVEIDGGGHSPRHEAGRDRVLHANGYSVLRLSA